jgi:hypothetical protein
VFLGEDGTASIAGDSNDSNPLSINAGSFDNCDVFWFVSQSQFSCTDLGVNTVILTATDAAGHSMTCEATVTVIDPLLPTIDCVADATVNTSDDGTDGDCNYDAGTEFDPAIADNTFPACELTLTNDYNGGSSLDGESFSATGSPYTINWTVADAAGNSAACATVITVLDEEAPVFTYCPDDIEQDALTGNCLSLVSWTEPNMDDVTDNCGVFGIAGPFASDPTVQIISQSNGDAFGNFPIGTTTVSYIVSDIYANQTTCEFTVTVNDNQAPLIFDFEDYYEVPFNALYCGALVDVEPPIAYDQCGTLTYSCDYTGTDSGLDVYPAGFDTEVTWTVTDEAGNSATATAIVRVGKLNPATNLRAVCRADKGFVKFKFDPAAGAQRYAVQVRAAGGGDFLWTKLNYNANVTVAYLPMDSLPEGEYQWRVVSYCKMADAENLPGWEEYSKRYTKWEDLDLPCSSAINLVDDESTADGKISELEIFSADIFPNPNNGTFNIRTDMEMYNLEIMDAEGKLVYSLDKVTEQFMEISLNDLNNGIYLVRMFNDGSMITKRITVQK